jgi:hypothetical protein
MKRALPLKIIQITKENSQMKNKEKLSPQRYVHVHCSSLVTKEIKLG